MERELVTEVDDIGIQYSANCSIGKILNSATAGDEATIETPSEFIKVKVYKITNGRGENG